MPPATRQRRCDQTDRLLADQLGFDLPARETFLKSFTSECPLLDPMRSEQGSYDSEYHLRINVDWERLDSMES
mgnify:CR=1 FL=1